MPAAARASRSAVAGATKTRSARLAEPDVRDIVHVIPDAGGDGLAGQRGPGRLADETQRVWRGHDPDLVAGLGEQPQQLAGLVGGDARAYPEDDAHRHLPWPDG